MTRATAPTRKTSLSLLPADLAWLDRYRSASAYGGTVGQLREDLTLLQALLADASRRLAGTFSRGEVMLIADSLNGTAFSPEAVAVFWTEVADNVGLNQAHEKFGLTKKQGQDLARRLKAMPMMDAYAVWHWIRVFWTDPGHDPESLCLNFGCPPEESAYDGLPRGNH